MEIKTERPYKTIVGTLIGCLLAVLAIGNAPLWKRALIFIAFAVGVLSLVKDLVIDENGVSNTYPFIPFLRTKKIGWSEINRIEFNIKSVLTDGLKNPSTMVVSYKKGGRYLINFEPNKEQFDVIKSLAKANNVEVRLTGLPPV